MTMHFFLGTNGPNGFYSYFDDLIDYKTAKHVTIIKGSPGSGKSTFMKTIAAKLALPDAEYIHCASDPDSLDGVVFPTEGIAFVDGTAPHVVEPVFPGVVDHYLNTALFTDITGLTKERATLTALMSANKMCYTLTTPWIQAASLLEEAAYKRVVTPEVEEKVKSRGKSLCQREITKTNRPAVTPTKRFLSAVTSAGLLCQFDTVIGQFDRVIALDDNFGLAALMLPDLANYAGEQGYKTYACYDPLHPESNIEHVLIPELSLAFVTNSHLLPYPAQPSRHIRLDACIPAESIAAQRTSLRFINKTKSACLEEAAGHLGAGKLVHDEIERIYAGYVDFPKIDEVLAEKLQALQESL